MTRAARNHEAVDVEETLARDANLDQGGRETVSEELEEDPEVAELVKLISEKLRDTSSHCFEIAGLMARAKALGTTRFATVRLELGYSRSAAYKWVKIHLARHFLRPIADDFAVDSWGTLHALSLLKPSKRDELACHLKENSIPVVTREQVNQFKTASPSKRNPPFRFGFSAKLKKGQQLSVSEMREIRDHCRAIKKIGGDRLSIRESDYTANNEPDAD